VEKENRACLHERKIMTDDESMLHSIAARNGVEFRGLQCGIMPTFHDPVTGNTFGRANGETLADAILRQRMKFREKT
jgi:hypothetical protein